MALATQQAALDRLRRHLQATRPQELEHPAGPPHWGPALLAGRLVELSSSTGAGVLTWAVRLAAEVQRAGRPVAWVMTTAGGLYPPDAAANGVALEALAVVRVPEFAALGRAAERLARSGGFGLIVLELGPCRALPAALQGLLVQHTLRHGGIVLCLTDKPERTPSLGSLVSLRAQTRRRRIATPLAPLAAAPSLAAGLPGSPAQAARFLCALQVSKDKRGGPGWGQEQICHGPPGLR